MTDKTQSGELAEQVREACAKVCDAQETESFMVLSTARAGAAAMKAACVKAIRSLKANPAPIASGDALDARRYRWIRSAAIDADVSKEFVNICESEPETPELFDTAIADAMLKERAK